MLSIYLSLHKQGGLVKTWKEIEQIEEYNPIYSLSIYLSIYLSGEGELQKQGNR